MGKMKVWFSALLIVVFSFAACGGSSPKPAGDSASTEASQPGEKASAPAAAKDGFRKLGDVLDAWSALFNANEKVINGYEGMPILELVTPPLALTAAIQFDLLNPDIYRRIPRTLFLDDYPWEKTDMVKQLKKEAGK